MAAGDLICALYVFVAAQVPGLEIPRLYNDRLVDVVAHLKGLCECETVHWVGAVAVIGAHAVRGVHGETIHRVGTARRRTVPHALGYGGTLHRHGRTVQAHALSHKLVGQITLHKAVLIPECHIRVAGDLFGTLTQRLTVPLVVEGTLCHTTLVATTTGTAVSGG